jgi:S-adenosylmethionine-diacylgycerolhomoserine-N-methlytransferase
MSAAGPADVAVRMDRMYRHQRLIYDLTRKYYLIGRDRAIERLAPPDGGSVVEIGCGTGRNLVLAARRWPAAGFLGIDASREMLRTAEAKIAGAGLAPRVRLAFALAEDWDAAALGLRGGADRVLFSYALSMIDLPIAALERARAQLAPGGRIVVVDFADMAGLPAPARAGLRAWLDRFGVHPRPEVAAWMERTGPVRRTRLLGGYAEILELDGA